MPIIVAVKTSARTYVHGSLPFTLIPAVELYRLEQHWSLFAPYLRKRDVWYLLLAKVKGHQEQLKLMRPDAYTARDKPDEASASYLNFRVRKYLRNLRRKSKKSSLRRHFQWVYSSWSASHRQQERLESFKLIFMSRKTLFKSGHTKAVAHSLYDQTCRH